MRVAYDILLSLTINHLYFFDKVFEGFELIPNKKTSDLINNVKLISKKRSNNWSLFLQTEGPFATTTASLIDKEFLFTLKITDSIFYSVTSNNYLNEKDEMLLFNSPINSVMVPEKRKVYPLKFDYTIHHATRPVNIKVANAKGTDIVNDIISDAGLKQKEINLILAGESFYNISEDTVPPGSLEIEKIFAKDILNDDVFYGSVYFKILPVVNNANSNKYEIDIETNN